MVDLTQECYEDLKKTDQIASFGYELFKFEGATLSPVVLRTSNFYRTPSENMPMQE